MASQLEICNIAILDAGGNPISAFPSSVTGSSTIEEVSLYYNYTPGLDFLLGEHPWRFAKKWASLTENGSYTFVDDTYDTAWAVPADFIRWSDLENNGPSHIEFARRDTHFLTIDYDAFEIEYIAQITDTTKFPNYFVVAFAAYLSMKLSRPLRRKGAKDKSDFMNDFQVALDNAKLKDSREDWQNETRTTKHTSTNDTWITARG